MKHLDEKELDDLFTPETMLGNVDKLYKRLF
jgi:hypothetical protein